MALFIVQVDFNLNLRENNLLYHISKLFCRSQHKYFAHHCEIWLWKHNISYMTMQIPAVYWWYKTSSHAAELTAGFYNPTNQDGYSPIFDMLKKHSAAMKFVCYGPQHSAQESDEALADLEGLSWQVATIFYSFVLGLCSHFLISGCYESFSAMNQQ